MDPEAKLVQLLTHYLKLACTSAGVTWNGENDTEVRIIGSHIRQMIDDAIEAHCEHRPHIHADGSTA